MAERTITLTDLPDGYEIEPAGRVFVIERSEDADGNIVRTHRRPIEPDDAITAESKEVKDIAKVARKADRLALHEARKARLVTAGRR